MISAYIENLKSFKKNQLSKLIDAINIKIFNALNSPNFSPRIAPYFKGMHQPGILFPEQDLINDPDNISQIKKILNALYYARETFIFLEGLDFSNLRHSYEDVKLLFSKTIDDAYQASYLLTHLDVDIKDLFGEELGQILPLINKFNALVTNLPAPSQPAAIKQAVPSLSYRVGEVSGMVIEQMQPNSGSLNYNVLTQFSAELPGYVDNITQYISQYSSEIIEKESKLHKEKIAELQNAGIKLLNDLENLKSGSAFISLRVLNYIHILNNIFTLSMSFLEQMGHLNDSTQDVIRSKLAQLKYSLLPSLFGLVDKVEVNSMLKPGTLSKPLMEKIKPFYQILIHYASKPVNFQRKGEELLSIEDSRFLSLRLEQTYKRINTAKKTLFKINKAQEALTAFYGILDKFKDQQIHNLAKETRDQLIEHYKVIRPYMAKIDFPFSNALIGSLYGNESLSTTLIKRPWKLILGILPGNQKRIPKPSLDHDHVSEVKKKKEALQRLISKKIGTQQFHIDLNMDLINSVYQETNLVLFPYNEETNVFAIDESIALNIDTTVPSKLKFKQENNQTIVDNCDYLSGDQALALHAWYTNKRDKLETAHNAYRKFMAALANVPKNSQNIPNIQKTNEQLKAELRNLYNIIQPYFIGGILKEAKERWQTLDLYVNQCLLNKLGAPLTTKKELFEEKSEYVQKYMADLEKQTSGAGEKKKITIARQAYKELLAELKNPLNQAAFNFLGDNRTKAHARELYKLIQPYFTNALIEEEHEKILAFDRSIVHSLSKKEHLARPEVNFFEQKNDYFQRYLTDVDLLLMKKRQEYMKIAQEKLHAENNASRLQQEHNTENRANYLISHTKYSTFINEFRVSMLHLTELFNKAMRDQITPMHKGVSFMQILHKDKKIPNVLPFPELSDSKLALIQSKQVIAIKRISNALFHLEGVILELEKLKNTHQEAGYKFKSLYVYHLLLAYGHINEILDLSKSLAADPHFNLIGQHLIAKGQTLLTTIQQQSAPYQKSPETILDATGQQVTVNGLWYTLNTAFIIPAHIRALSNTRSITQEEIDKLHQHAKLSTIRIENIIKGSHSYFKLFLQTPEMYRLYKDLTNKLNEFISTSHDTLIDNLDKIKEKIFTPILLEADEWEDRLGLKPGIFSAPIKRITDEYYQGLLQPLELNSTRHISLVCDKGPLEKRIHRTQEQVTAAEKNISIVEERYHHIKQLYKNLDSYSALKNALPIRFVLWGHTLENKLNIFEQQLIASYRKALPKLIELQKEMAFIPKAKLDNQEQSIALDKLLNAGTPEGESKLVQINELVALSYHHYLGERDSCVMQFDTAKEKLKYLTDLQNAQEAENQLFVKEYIEESFKKQLKVLCSRHVGLQYTDEEYRTKLQEFLLTFSQEIIHGSKNAEDINLAIRMRIKEKISLFEKAHFAGYYHLDTIRIALAQFKNYFSQSNLAIENNESVFENEVTLEKKSAEINNLIKFAKKKKLSIEDRVTYIQQKVNDPNFERIILNSKKEHYFSFNYLVQCLVALLEALYLYTSSRKALCNHLNSAANNKPQISELTKRFGLFAGSTIPREKLAPSAAIAKEQKPLPDVRGNVAAKINKELDAQNRKEQADLVRPLEAQPGVAPGLVARP